MKLHLTIWADRSGWVLTDEGGDILAGGTETLPYVVLPAAGVRLVLPVERTCCEDPDGAVWAVERKEAEDG